MQYAETPIKDALEIIQSVTCPNKSTCPDGETCCKNNFGSYSCCPVPDAVCCKSLVDCCPNANTCCDNGGCCPVPNAVCCKDSTSCCEHGWKCDDKGGCIRSHFFPMLMDLPEELIVPIALTSTRSL